MTVSDLIEFLQSYADPDATVLAVWSYYDGSSSCIVDSNAVAYASPSYVVISADDYYYKQHAVAEGEYLASLDAQGQTKERPD